VALSSRIKTFCLVYLLRMLMTSADSVILVVVLVTSEAT
jgi:hypothetical protein